MYKAIKLRVNNTIRTDGDNDTAGNIFDFVIILLIIANVIVVIAETFSLPEVAQRIFRYIEIASIIVFTIEYILRIWTADYIYSDVSPAKARLKYALSFMAVIDLLAILPFYLPFVIKIDLRVLRMLRIIRLLRVFKVNRYTDALSTIGSVFVRKKSQLLSSIAVVVLLMVIAAVLMYNVENVAQPDAFSNAFDALWWAVSTLTTVGYGDIYPVTALGKLFSGVIALLGIGLVAVPTGIISAGFVELLGENGIDENKKYCPYCGHKID